MSTTWSSDLVLGNYMIFSSNFYLIKKICPLQHALHDHIALDYEQRHALQNNWIGYLDKYSKSCKSNFNHNTSESPSAIPLNNDILFFPTLPYHKLTNVKQPDVERLSLIAPSWSALVYTSMLYRSAFLVNKIPFSGAIFRYFIIHDCICTFSPRLCIYWLTTHNA